MVNHEIISIFILTLISTTIAQFDQDAIIFPDQIFSGPPESSQSGFDIPSADYKSSRPVYQHASEVHIYDVEAPSNIQQAYDVQPPRNQYQPMKQNWYPSSSQGAQANANAQAMNKGSSSQAAASSQTSGSSQGYGGSVTSNAHASSQSSGGGRFYCPPYCSLLYSASSAASATSGVVNGVPVAASSASAAGANAQENSGSAASASSTAMGNRRW